MTIAEAIELLRIDRKNAKVPSEKFFHQRAMWDLDTNPRGCRFRCDSGKPVEELSDSGCGMCNLPLLDDLAVRIENADLMCFGAPINANE